MLVGRRTPPMWVYQDAGTWKWACRICQKSDWRPGQPNTLAAAHTHLARHATFGFASKNGDQRKHPGKGSP